MPKFDIERIVQIQKATDEMDLLQTSEYIRDTAPDIHETPIADAIITGSYDPVAWAQEYNALAGERAMEYAAGKAKWQPMGSIVQWPLQEQTVRAALEAANHAGTIGYPVAIKAGPSKIFPIENIPVEVLDSLYENVEVLV
jgi:hypothetical protein